MKMKYITISTEDQTRVDIFLNHIVSIYDKTRGEHTFGHILTSCGVIYTTKESCADLMYKIINTGKRNS